MFETNVNITLLDLCLFTFHSVLLSKIINPGEKVMFNDKLVYKVVIWVFSEMHIWKEKEALNTCI